MMDHRHTVLLIEDTDASYEGIRRDFDAGGWRVFRARDERDVWHQLQRLTDEGHTVDAIALDLGLPPFVEEPLQVGLPLAEELRRRYPAMPILAYTQLGLNKNDQDFGLILHKFLPLRVSFVAPRQFPANVTFADLLEHARQGFVFVSPGIANLLPKAVPARPDPLTPEQWHTLRLVSDGLTRKEIAAALPGVGESGVKARLLAIATRLRDVEELESYEGTPDDLKRWYREHYARYCRDQA